MYESRAHSAAVSGLTQHAENQRQGEREETERRKTAKNVAKTNSMCYGCTEFRILHILILTHTLQHTICIYLFVVREWEKRSGRQNIHRARAKEKEWKREKNRSN